MSALITHLPAATMVLVTGLALVCIGVLIWCALPQSRTRRDADIDRQIKTLRKGADHSAQHRPRVPATRPKACGRGLCRHQADCSDVYCPGRSGPDHHAGR